MHPSTVRMFNRDFVGHADKPYDFFMSRYSEAYKAETLAFIECLVEDKPSPCKHRARRNRRARHGHGSRKECGGGEVGRHSH